MIPIGRTEYRAQLRESRTLHEGDERIPDSVRIAADGEPTRILGSWPGNKVQTAAAWSVLLDRVERDLGKWDRHHPTLSGRSTLSQVIAGGYTQYLTAAEGMPAKVEKKLDKIVLDFLWQGTGRHPINMDALRRPRSHGGLGLFCAEERNEAQYICWLGAYLSPPGKRPPWAFVADELLRATIRGADKRRVPEDDRLNPFVQDWKPNLNKLPFILKQMVRVARKYQLAIDGPYIPQEIRKAMSAWAHPAMLETASLRRRTPQERCLKKHHAVRTLDDLEEIAEQDDPDHTGEEDCECDNCEDDRAEGCRHPWQCQDFARDLLGDVAPKWNLATEQMDFPRPLWDTLADDRTAALEAGEEVVFDSAPNNSTDVSDYYRIFVHSHALLPAPAETTMRREPGLKNLPPSEENSIHVIACGSTIGGRTCDARGGYAIHFPDGEIPDVSGRCSSQFQTEERSAATAILAAARAVPLDRTLHIITNSKTVVKRLTVGLKAQEDAGWARQDDGADIFRATVAALRSRSAETTLLHIAKNRLAAWPAVELTRQSARDAARGDAVQEPDRTGLEEFDTPGISVVGITQSRALHAIRQAKLRGSGQRRATTRGLSAAKGSIKQLNGQAPTDEQIWRATRHRDISRNVRNFQWKGLHGAHKVGNYFRGMPAPWGNYEQCPTCGVTESMSHIVLDCPDSAQETIWDLAGEFLSEKLVWEKPTIGTIWGCALARPKGLSGEADPGAERAYRIVVSESAFLAWKIRCEKRIEHEDEPDWAISPSEVKRRWYHIVNTRIAHDRLLTNKRRYGRRAYKADTVLATWSGLIEGVENLTAEQLRQPGVLVGTGTMRHARGVG